MRNKNRPDILKIHNANEFLQWYWLKDEMQKFCRNNGLSTVGKKFDLRGRIASFLEGDGHTVPSRAKPTSTFDWAKEKLTLDTRITDSVTFGKNFRGFMKGELGSGFVCHSDFMDWVKSNPGASLKDAVNAWLELEKRKTNPDFKRKIAPQNMLAQYTRDFFEDNPQVARQEMMRCWKNKKRLPAKGGKVVYEKSDRKWIQ